MCIKYIIYLILQSVGTALAPFHRLLGATNLEDCRGTESRIVINLPRTRTEIVQENPIGSTVSEVLTGRHTQILILKIIASLLMDVVNLVLIRCHNHDIKGKDNGR